MAYVIIIIIIMNVMAWHNNVANENENNENVMCNG